MGFCFFPFVLLSVRAWPRSEAKGTGRQQDIGRESTFDRPMTFDTVGDGGELKATEAR